MSGKQEKRKRRAAGVDLKEDRGLAAEARRRLEALRMAAYEREGGSPEVRRARAMTMLAISAAIGRQ